MKPLGSRGPPHSLPVFLPCLLPTKRHSAQNPGSSKFQKSRRESEAASAGPCWVPSQVRLVQSGVGEPADLSGAGAQE